MPVTPAQAVGLVLGFWLSLALLLPLVSGRG